MVCVHCYKLGRGAGGPAKRCRARARAATHADRRQRETQSFFYAAFLRSSGPRVHSRHPPRSTPAAAFQTANHPINSFVAEPCSTPHPRHIPTGIVLVCVGRSAPQRHHHADRPFRDHWPKHEIRPPCVRTATSPARLATRATRSGACSVFPGCFGGPAAFPVLLFPPNACTTPRTP